METKKQELLKLLRREKIEPKRLSIYLEAITHKSYSNENRNGTKNYQRLEFLGDACIEWVITNFVFSRQIKDLKGSRELDEGEMTRMRAQMVCTESLSQAAIDLGLDQLVQVGKGFSSMNNVKFTKIYEDVFEAFIGAVAQDQGIKKAILIINKTLIRYYDEGRFSFEKDYKTIFQEEMQKISKSEINYVLVENLPDKKTIHLLWNGLLYGVGSGRNRKDAEINAARSAYEKISNNPKQFS